MGSVEEPQSVMTDRNTRAKRLPARALADTATRRPRSLPADTSVWLPKTGVAVATRRSGPRWVGGVRQGEVEGRSCVGARLRPHVATVTTNDATHGGEADPGALELARRVQPLEGHEELCLVGLVEADAVVADVERARPGAVRHAELDHRVLDRSRELPGIADEVVEHDAQEALVAGGAEALRGTEGDLP